MKRALLLLLAVVMVFSLFGCRNNEKAGKSGGGDYKIGIITGTVSQGEEEYQAAQKMVETYGKDKIVTATYPDNFSTETEATIAQVVGLASDPKVKAIVFVQAVPGAAAAIDKVHLRRSCRRSCNGCKQIRYLPAGRRDLHGNLRH